MKRIIMPLLLFPLLAYSQYRADCFSLDFAENALQIKTEDVFERDTILPLNIRSVVTGLSVSGTCVLNNDDDSYVRVILVDEYNYEFLVYENYPLLSDGLTTEFTNTAMETVSLGGITPQYLRIDLQNATVRLASVNYTITSSEREEGIKNPVTIQKEQALYIVDRLNANLKKKNMTWRAGLTSMSEKTYSEKKDMFGGNVPELYGLEYYVGGIFVVPGSQNSSAEMEYNQSNLFVGEWDWRNRHGKNWMTSVKDQGNCFSCWAFSAVGALEAYVNLYYNRMLDCNLAEQELMNCISGYGCNHGGNTGVAFNYVENNGIVNEECFNYIAADKNCSVKCEYPEEKIYLENHYYINNSLGEDYIKQKLFKSPIVMGIEPWWHALVLVGFKTVEVGDHIFIKTSSQSIWVTINSTDHANLIGRTAWLLKNSHGTDWGDSGYAYVITNACDLYMMYGLEGRITSINYTDNDIVCEDADGDGYYFWGIGPKPANSSSTIPDTPDGDDSDPTLGPIDQYGNLTILTDEIVISNLVNYNSVMNFTHNIRIVNGGHLRITSITTLWNESQITVENGGTLTIDGGTLDNARITFNTGSILNIQNGGIVKKAVDEDFYTPVGASVNITNGKIL